MRRIGRRRFLVNVGVLFASASALGAPAPSKPVRIGWIGVSTLDNPETRGGWDAFRIEFQKRGWEEGKNVQFIQRFGKGDQALTGQYARELLDAKVDLIVTISGRVALELKKATTSIPIVFLMTSDPVGIGLVASLARPGANLTGFSMGGTDLAGKRLELLKEAFPGIGQVAYLPSLSEAGNERAYRFAQKLGMKLIPAHPLKDGNFARAVAAMAHADAWFIADTPVNFANSRTIIAAIGQQRKPAIYPSSFFTALGGLMSYAADQRDIYRRAAVLVDRILRGAKPAELPVEQPTIFEFVVNMTTAKAHGLTIPQSMRFRIDRVIE